MSQQPSTATHSLGSNFIREQWYMFGWASELDAGTLVARKILGEDVVAFRTADGNVAILEDRCCHRALPLSMGVIVGDNLRCIYHGLEYNTAGRCVKIPGQAAIPRDFCVRCYPAVERNKIIWMWAGRRDSADISRVPDYPYHDDPAHWPTAYDSIRIACNYELIHDNLLDLTHLSYVHASTIGGDPNVHFEAKMEVEVHPTSIFVKREMPGSPPPPTYARSVKLAEQVDRWQEVRFRPGLVLNYSGAVDAGSVRETQAGYRARNLNALTPETATTSHYFFSASHGHNTDDPSWTARHFAEIKRTFLEDVEVLERQQIAISENPALPLKAVAADRASMQARRMIQRLLQEERSSELNIVGLQGHTA